MDKKIRKQLKADYEELNIKPSDKLWDQIEDQLDGREKTVQKPLFQWWKYAAVIVLLISFGSILYYNSDKSSKSAETIAVKEVTEENLKPSKTSETVANVTNPETENNFEIKTNPEKTIVKKEINKTDQEQTDLPKMTSVSKIIASAPEIEVKNETKIKQEITETPKLVVIEKSSKTKYVTANDLMFQHQYSVEKNEKPNENTKRLGIIKINKVNISPEFITIFNSSSSTDEK
ncbi:hypothetical protein [Chryseobacterium sp. 2R14A]|uniref:hypothetical protein n=1 Tax=Chryseobacterium sp. 2R14A TaxID=3380353 RepID=UPI003CF43915